MSQRWVRLLPVALVFLGACKLDWSDSDDHSCFNEHADPNDLPPECRPPVSCEEALCAERGGTCFSGSYGLCVFEDELCPEGTTSVCREGAVHACDAGHVAVTAYACAAPKQCTVGTDGAVSIAVCAVNSTPCREGATGECRGNVAVACQGGYPIAEQVCDPEGFRCYEPLQGSGAGATCAALPQ